MIKLPDVPLGNAIPKVIHQTCPSKTNLSPAIRDNIAHLKRQNPTFEHVLYDDADISTFIMTEYGPQVLAAYQRISPTYGAARADLFRYLLMYRVGGVYLDIKSTTIRPLADTVRPEDRYLLSHWDNRPGDEYEGWGHDVEYPGQPRGEFQQWHIVAAPGHPFLKAILTAVLDNIERYSPWSGGVGRLAVLSSTGPIAYTRAIMPLLSSVPHRLANEQAEIGLRYSCLGDKMAHRKLSPTYYRYNAAPLVSPVSLIGRASTSAYVALAHVKKIARKTREAK